MHIFSNRAGRVVMMPEFTYPFTIGLEFWDGMPTMRAVLTRIGIAGQGNYQFIHTLREFIYVYVFGERIGEIQIGGVGFAGGCPDDSNPAGIENVLSYYEQYRISSYGAPVAISLGATKFYEGFLTSCKAECADPQTGLSQFTMVFNFFPDAVQSDKGEPTQVEEEELQKLIEEDEVTNQRPTLLEGIVVPGVTTVLTEPSHITLNPPPTDIGPHSNGPGPGESITLGSGIFDHTNEPSTTPPPPTNMPDTEEHR